MPDRLSALSKYYFLLIFFVCTSFFLNAQPEHGLVARFSFNNGSELEELSGAKIKLVGTRSTDDRFGNKNNAVYVFGNKYSYINLGNNPTLKQKNITISLWVRIENPVYSGWGREVNPIMITKRNRNVDFYEAYSMGYYYETKNVIGLCTKDSTREVSISGTREFKLRKWHHLALTYDFNSLSFYIDGELENTMKKGFDLEFDPLDSVLIGSTASSKNSRYLNAIVDDIRFYNRALNADEIQMLYDEPDPNRTWIALKWIAASLLFIGLLIILTLYIRYRTRKTLIKEKQKLEVQNLVLQTELRVNRALMNPHFVFNSLNALQNLILKKEYQPANDYLVKFSRLMRLILENNMSDDITLDHEIDMLKRYLELEDLRFHGNINYNIEVENTISPSFVHIPVMMIQPFVENAIWHGLLNKDGEKKLNVRFSKSVESYIDCEIEDNGIGRRKNNSNRENKSLATMFIEQRLELLNKIHKLNCRLLIEDKPNESGTLIKIRIPILNPVSHA
ncbi:MAG: histidine kinase [Bacteroidia bacterium]|nr:histidine kinase [Bacteroidia bacterium]